MIPLAEFDFSNGPMVVAHRGSSGLAPENTIAALARGVLAGADMVEIDVQQTVDRHLIVFHDHILGRTTNGAGRVDGRTLQEIRLLDAGSWKSREFAGEKVPLLHEALDYLRGRAYVNIELKRSDVAPGNLYLKNVVDIVVDHRLEAHTLLSSFDHELLYSARDYNQRIPTAVILEPGDRRLASPIARSVGASAVVLSRRQLTRRVAEDAAAARLPIGVYTINTPEECAWSVDRGAHALVTNHPEIVVAAIRRTAGAR